ncbi:Delta(12)-fatty-acid desaturase [Hyella patelloides LEGE 07179]|uniref:Delta(12)-fatty-acid desaturase n=1 Tax=Hyella patelloides LEGE 07179 TaxID=945734 RepID=A0A563W5B3_9CYAN|nr:fatty acid desaturase [Hyella patelloides]VEP18830.1 Delta(12)-fatty-acid desaturase [Hyella patelloides LEGE 07179]
MTTLIPLRKSPQLDSNIKLRDIINTLPKEVFVKDARKAWLTVIVNLACVTAGYWLIAISPWFLLPFAWIFLGTSLAGMFVIGHDCGHRSFSNRIWVNDLVGHLMFLPTIYPYHAWRILHNHHHKHTNKLEVDNAWDPFTPETYDSFSPTMQWWYRRLRSRFWWVGSIAHWASLHFSWWAHTGKDKEQIRFSALFVIVGAAIGFPALFLTVGFWGFVKFWLTPWIVYHFWISTFTVVHHTLPDIPFKPEGEWNAAEAQLCGTVHCKYPWWVEFLCHDINVHIPHHLTTGIPWYNLRQAHASLQENWGEYLHETEFSWSLMKQIGDRCHLYDVERKYQSFAQYSVK